MNKYPFPFEYSYIYIYILNTHLKYEKVSLHERHYNIVIIIIIEKWQQALFCAFQNVFLNYYWFKLTNTGLHIAVFYCF